LNQYYEKISSGHSAANASENDEQHGEHKCSITRLGQHVKHDRKLEKGQVGHAHPEEFAHEAEFDPGRAHQVQDEDAQIDYDCRASLCAMLVAFLYRASFQFHR
jgi:hypothetical protein